MLIINVACTNDSGSTGENEIIQIGVTELSISRYIHGGRIVSVPILIDICKALNVSADYLLGLSEVEK